MFKVINVNVAGSGGQSTSCLDEFKWKFLLSLCP